MRSVNATTASLISGYATSLIFLSVINRGEREKVIAKTEIEDLQTQLEQMNKSKVNYTLS